MHIYVYISAVLFFILIPILFALLLRAIYDKKSGIYTYSVHCQCLRLLSALCFYGGILNEKCQSYIQ